MLTDSRDWGKGEFVIDFAIADGALNLGSGHLIEEAGLINELAALGLELLEGGAGWVSPLIGMLLHLFGVTDGDLAVANKGAMHMEADAAFVKDVWELGEGQILAYNSQLPALKKEIEAYEKHLAEFKGKPMPSAADASLVTCVGESASKQVIPVESLAGFSYSILIIASDAGISLDDTGKATLSGSKCGNYTLRYILKVNCGNSILPIPSLSYGVITGTVKPETVCKTPPDVPCPEQLKIIHDALTGCDRYGVDATIQCGATNPNNLEGPWGFGDAHVVASGTPLDYVVEFENDPEKASAPAAVVKVVETLDSDLDWQSFRLGTISFGDITIDIGGNGSFETRLDLRGRFGIYLDVSAGIDLATGLVTWELKSIDPETGDVPFSPLLGFLPPNLNGSEGQGFLSYSIKPKSTATTGTRIDAQATIVFDQNEPIDTPAIFNTIDAGGPTSTVASLPETSYPGFMVSWAGEDDAGGSGVDQYSIMVSVDGGPFTTWLSATSLTEAVYDQAEAGHTYAFFSRAVDLVGNVEETEPHAEAQTSVIEPKTVSVSEVSVTGDPATVLVVQFEDDLHIQSMIDSGTITSAVTLSSTIGGPIALTASEFAYDATAHRLTVTLDKALRPAPMSCGWTAPPSMAQEDAVLRGGASGLVFQVEAFDAAQNVQTASENLTVNAAAVPSLVDWNSDGKLDLIVGEKTVDSLGKIRIYLNEGTSESPVYDTFSYVQTPDGDLTVPGSGCLGVFPRLFDWNGDGENDLVLGLADGTVQVWTNVNTSANPIFALPVNLSFGPAAAKTDINVAARATPVIVDWNDDGRPDLLVGGLDGRVRLYLNTATGAEPSFAAEQFVQDGAHDLTVASGRASAAVADLDGDGRKDLVLGDTDGELFFFRNVGTDAAPRSTARPRFWPAVCPCTSPARRARGRSWATSTTTVPDLLVGTLDGQVRLYVGHTTAPSTGSVTGAAGASYTYTFQVSGPLTAADDQYTTSTDTPLSVGVLLGVRGNDGVGMDPSASAVLVGSGPAHGRVVLNPDGSFTYTPATGFSGSDSFEYALTRGRSNRTPRRSASSCSRAASPPRSSR